MWIGSSERNLHEIFAPARRNAPCVLFFDEVDALGHKRSHLTTSSSMRNTVNQLLAEMDSLGGRQRRRVRARRDQPPVGRRQRAAPTRPLRPDAAGAAAGRAGPARRSCATTCATGRSPTSTSSKLAKATEHYSGADLAHICTTAAERALAESMRTGRLVPLTTRDLLAAAREVQPSTGPWFATARNVALFGNTDGSYDELAAYLRKHRSL